MTRVAVIGHVEWAEFVRVERVPRAGDIVHASSWWEDPGGGGAVAAVQLARLAGEVTFFTALGNDELGRRARAALEGMGVEVRAVTREAPQRRVIVFLDDGGERTITVLGSRMGPAGGDDLGWSDLAGYDAVYFTAGDEAALRAGRAARVLTATPRALGVLATGGVALDVLVGSATDPGEAYRKGDVTPVPRLAVRTEGARGGSYESEGGEQGRYAASAPPGPVVDTYGAGDRFAAGLTYGLGAGLVLGEALALGARCGAACLAGRGPYEGRLVRL